MYETAPPASQQYVVPSSMLHSADSSRRPSLSPQQTRTDPQRQRTPIQHQRRHLPRSGSQTRSEALMSYVADHLQTQRGGLAPQQPNIGVVPSQSAPTTPQIPAGVSSYTTVQQIRQVPYQTTQEYFPELLTAADVQQMPDFGFQLDPAYQDYYPLTRTATISAPMSDINVHNAFMATDVQRASGIANVGSGSLPPFSSFPSALTSTRGELEILSSKPKPQCWEHGCNGRQFSTFSNLLRHQREKSGSAMKATCPYCGTEFTRTTARNGHMYGGKCKGRPEDSEGSVSGREHDG